MARLPGSDVPATRRRVGTAARTPLFLRAATLVAAGTVACVLSRCSLAGGLRGFFKGIGVETGAPDNIRTYRVDNSFLKSSSGGLGYRKSKDEKDYVQGEGESWEAEVNGVDEGDGWLRVRNDRYLPFIQGGVQVLFPLTSEEEGVDWKDEAFRRQMQRIADMKAKAAPNYKKSPQEILEAQRRKAVWKAMSERSTEQVFDRDFGLGSTKGDGDYIMVELQKPLGINFLEVNPATPCGALIGDLAEGMSAQESGKLQIGDLLVKVGSIIVQGMPLDEAIQPIIDTEGSVILTFYRAN